MDTTDHMPHAIRAIGDEGVADGRTGLEGLREGADARLVRPADAMRLGGLEEFPKGRVLDGQSNPSSSSYSSSSSAVSSSQSCSYWGPSPSLGATACFGPGYGGSQWQSASG